MENIVVRIHHGYVIKGKRNKDITLRHLNGYDEEYLAENMSLLSSTRLTTGLLERIAMLGKVDPKLNEKIIRNLTIGDRMILILTIRKMLFGDNIQCVFSCPQCNEQLSSDLSVNAFLKKTSTPSKDFLDVKFSKYRLRIRPITGMDEEEILENKNVQKIEKIARSCIVSSKPNLPNTRLTEDFIIFISSKLEELDPHAHIVLDLICPSCKHSFQSLFNIEDFLYQEIRADKDQLEAEVNWLAMNYHWGLNEVMSLPRNKRKRYVELINITRSR